MDENGIKKLANLSRVELADDEVSKYSFEFKEILNYFDLLKEATAADSDGHLGVIENSSTRNVMRDDEASHESGIHTGKLVEAAPESKDGFIKVKKILQ